MIRLICKSITNSKAGVPADLVEAMLTSDPPGFDITMVFKISAQPIVGHSYEILLCGQCAGGDSPPQGRCVFPAESVNGIGAY